MVQRDNGKLGKGLTSDGKAFKRLKIALDLTTITAPVVTSGSPSLSKIEFDKVPELIRDLVEPPPKKK